MLRTFISGSSLSTAASFWGSYFVPEFSKFIARLQTGKPHISVAGIYKIAKIQGYCTYYQDNYSIINSINPGFNNQRG
jgi:hypothetical protein